MLGFSKHLLAQGIKRALGVTGVQIGQVIITGESKWHNLDDKPTYDLLLANGSVFSAVTHPRLALIYPLLVLPNITTEAGSPFPYKIVADYTGVV